MSEIQKEFEEWYMGGDEDTLGILMFSDGKYKRPPTQKDWVAYQSGWLGCSADRVKRMRL